MMAQTLTHLFLFMLATCALILLVGWVEDAADSGVRDRSRSDTTRRRNREGAWWFHADADLECSDWPREMTQIGLRDLDQEGWWD